MIMRRMITTGGPSSFLLVLVLVSATVADKGYFWHVTDFHYDQTYWTTGLSCNEDVPEPGVFGDEWCDSPWKLVQETVTAMKQLKPDVDFIIWTGDSVAHIKDKDMDLETNLQIVNKVSSFLKSEFANVPIYPSLGNHDFYPSDQANVTEDAFYTSVSSYWEDWIGTEEEKTRFQQGGYYSRLLSPTSKLRLLALNTNLYYTSNHLTKDVTDPAGQFAWLRQTLTAVRNNGEKAIITAHIPPGLLTPNFVLWMYPKHNEALVSLLVDFSDVIVATHYGHDHMDGFKVMQNDDGSKAVPQFIAPSVTPWRFRIPNLTGKAHNPGVRLLEYDRVTGKHYNYQQFYMNVTEANANSKADWSELYNFTDAYHVPDMSVASLRQIFKDMEVPGSKSGLRYCKYSLVTDEPQECTDKMQMEIVCGGHIADLDEANKCVETFLSSAPLSVPCSLHLTLTLSFFSLLAWWRG